MNPIDCPHHQLPEEYFVGDGTMTLMTSEKIPMVKCLKCGTRIPLREMFKLV
jgi:hypothetical protein